jgi:hypothetical protein
MKRVSIQTLYFAILSLVFIILLVFLRFMFQPYPLISYQDVFDLLTPLVLIPFYWLLFKRASNEQASLAEEVTFLVLAAFWVEGQGMHLSANSINNLIGNLAKNQVIDITPTDIYQLTNFLDEFLSHYLWHIGLIGLAALLITREVRRPAGNPTVWWAATVAGIIYGFSYFSVFLEGNTLAIGLPFSLLVIVFTLVSERKKLAQRPILAFFFISCLLAFLLFAGWGLYWGGFPEFSDVGLI